MENIYSQGVADYLNNKFGEDFTLAEPGYAKTLHKPQRIVIVKDWNNADEWMRCEYEKAQKERKNLLGFVL